MAVNIPTAYNELIFYLARIATPEQILNFTAFEAAQKRTIELLDRSSDGTLTLDERFELEQMLYFDRIVSSLKAKAFETVNQRG